MLNINVGTEVTDFRVGQLVDDEGFFLDPYDWRRSFSIAMAAERNIVLTDKHWALIELIRSKYLILGAIPPMRSVCRAIGFEKHELKEQFGSCLFVWKLAGLPNPGEEAISYMG